MTLTPLDIRSLDPHHLSDDEAIALNRFENVMRAEQWPEDSPVTSAVTVDHFRFVPPNQDHHHWVAWTDAGQVVARGFVTVPRTADNQHIAEFDVDVLPSMRRRGLGKRLLANIAGVAAANARGLLLFTTDAAIPQGKAFAASLNARRGLALHTNQLLLRETAWDVVKQWSTRRRAKRDFEFGVWEGPYPPEYLEAMVEIKQIINTAPMGKLEVEAFTWSLRDLRDEEKALRQQGGKRWTVYVRHRKTGRFAGITDVSWTPDQPDGYEQGYTIVAPEFRNLGLGQWLKAEMLLTLAALTPSLEWVRTGNADANESMISINRRLGFRRRKSWTLWQIGLQQVVEYLDAEGQRPA